MGVKTRVKLARRCFIKVYRIRGWFRILSSPPIPPVQA
ncbi:hypothetical protein GACE_1867 [Geoglobus acetivorans]|uniref:Uncharacterized protein n=1 Tax=Geoglobus acetivorans TaxID=565033 RepID=A0A0A7GGF1_GEOAI|nr:hypothetical protein GACE_1867 [Geoglobus acetivorans]